MVITGVRSKKRTIRKIKSGHERSVRNNRVFVITEFVIKIVYYSRKKSSSVN